MIEEYKVISKHPSYEISNTGIIRDVNTKKIKNQTMSNKGYKLVCLNGKPYLVHRLVAMVFIPNPDGYLYINHKDENKTNNCVDNLEWCTNEYNERYGTKIERVAIALSKGRVIQYDDNGNILKIWNSLESIARAGMYSVKTSIRRGIFNRYYFNSFWFRESERFDKSRKAIVKTPVRRNYKLTYKIKWN